MPITLTLLVCACDVSEVVVVDEVVAALVGQLQVGVAKQQLTPTHTEH